MYSIAVSPHTHSLLAAGLALKREGMQDLSATTTQARHPERRQALDCTNTGKCMSDLCYYTGVRTMLQATDDISYSTRGCNQCGSSEDFGDEWPSNKLLEWNYCI